MEDPQTRILERKVLTSPHLPPGQTWIQRRNALERALTKSHEERKWRRIKQWKQRMQDSRQVFKWLRPVQAVPDHVLIVEEDDDPSTTTRGAWEIRNILGWYLESRDAGP